LKIHVKLKKKEDIEDIKDKELKIVKEQLINMKKEIEKLKQNPKIQNNNNIQINIHSHINPHGQEKIDNIQDIVNMIINCKNPINHNLIIPNMVKKINIDDKSNRNVYIPNINRNHGLVLENGEWNYKAMDSLLNDLMIDNMDRVSDFIIHNKELFLKKITIGAYNELTYSLELYFDKMIDKTECMKKIKDILIGNRPIVSTNYEDITGDKIKMN
jgi:hypothetical protein